MSISENGGVSTVTASMNRPSSEAVTVTVFASAVFPAVSGNFTQSGTTLTITAGQTNSTGTVTITAEDNDTDAPDKDNHRIRKRERRTGCGSTGCPNANDHRR